MPLKKNKNRLFLDGNRISRISCSGKSPRAELAKSKKEFVGFDAREYIKILPDFGVLRKGFLDGKKVDDIAALDITGVIYASVKCGLKNREY